MTFVASSKSKLIFSHYGLRNLIPQKWVRLLKEYNPIAPANLDYVGKIL